MMVVRKISRGWGKEFHRGKVAPVLNGASTAQRLTGPDSQVCRLSVTDKLVLGAVFLQMYHASGHFFCLLYCWVLRAVGCAFFLPNQSDT